MTNKLLKNAVIVDVKKSTNVEKAILILKENAETIDDETIIEEANKIIDDFDRKSSRKRKWF